MLHGLRVAHTQRDRASVLCYAGTTAERAQETLDVTVSELQRLGEGIEQSELDRLKARIKSSLIMQQESTQRPQRRARPRLVPLGAGADAGRSRPVGRRAVGRKDQRVSGEESAERFVGRDAGPEPLEMPVGIS